MDQRQIEKERIRLTREIAMLESQLDSAIRGKEEKLNENKQIKEEIGQLEEENKGLEEETRRLDEEISGLDEEFKQAQIDAGRLRREIKVNTERAEAERKKAAELRTVIARHEKTLETHRREIKQEIDDRRSLESRLRKTNAQIEAMKQHKMAGFVTKRLEKQDWYRRVEEPMPAFEEPETPTPEAATVQAQTSEPTQAPAQEEKKKDSDDGGIDFSVK
jgi:chromosome segregation ATPase